MKWRSLWISIFICGYIQLNACSNSTSHKQVEAINNNANIDPGYKKIAYDSTILVIDKRCENCETWGALFSIKEFVELYEHSSFYLPDGLSFLSNNKYSNKEKKISICSMQKATIEEYSRILNESQELYDSGKISEDILNWAIAPNFSTTHLVVRNFNNEKVKKILNSIHEDKAVSSKLKELIESILSGELWNNIEEIEGRN